MNLRREATATIWKTVVFAGAMLGSACSKNKPPVAPTPDVVAKDPAKADDPCANKQPDPCADPCANPCGDGEWTDPCGDPCGRIRGDGDEGGEGRGFILS